jgi:mono/diheme cytochrome c family protein
VLGVISAVVVLAWSAHGECAEVDSFARRGQALVTRMCGNCHAIGKEGNSPHPSAPAFRNLERNMDLSELVVRLRRGPIAGHEDMPVFRFTRDEAQAIVAYLRSIQAP